MARKAPNRSAPKYFNKYGVAKKPSSVVKPICSQAEDNEKTARDVLLNRGRLFIVELLESSTEDTDITATPNRNRLTAAIAQ